MSHVLITGAASGIGREIGLAYARRGESLTIADRDAEALAAAGEAMARAGAADVGQLASDLSVARNAEALVAEAWDRAPVDVLVNSAGIYPATPFLELDATTWDRVQNINTRAPLLLTVALAKRAVAAGTAPSIVTISSGASLRSRPGAAPYSTSKAAVEVAMRSAALELGEHGIRVNCVSPGFVVVDSAANPVTDEYADAVGQNPLGRKGSPEDIARAVLWIAGDEAGWITGAVLRVDGGSSAGTTALPLHWASNLAADDADDAAGADGADDAAGVPVAEASGAASGSTDATGVGA